MSPINVALLGAGIFAKEAHLPPLLSNPNVNLVAVYSRSLNSAKSVLAEIPSESSTKPESIQLYSEDSDNKLDALLARDDIKAVVIALPILTQPEVIKKCILAGKHVLSEKPVAPTVAEAVELLEWYNKNSNGGDTIWSVAENFRFQAPWPKALAEANRLGGIRGIEVRVLQGVEKGGKYFETAWRKVPGYQGGFLLDGGVHFTAALRELLPKHHELTIASFSQLLQDHLPPHDTIRTVFRSAPKGGAVSEEDRKITGTFNISFGASSVRATSYTLDCPNGIVVVNPNSLKVTENGKEEQATKVEDDVRGVEAELAAFLEAIQKGVKGGDKKQSPELAIGDLEMIEAMLKSGEQGGVPQTLKYFTQL
ncbi:NAD(P)-binding protein [Ascobolus immersus RN42]|uniref:NAD(P)-binding protein n=1 Tax=Ascobolus immersus RN42 TaxID=1160509 RepID=A0A3N4IU08_ASCIM|nr:NAD(P)-binding protein [Ascobolus immersus RN42]